VGLFEQVCGLVLGGAVGLDGQGDRLSPRTGAGPALSTADDDGLAGEPTRRCTHQVKRGFRLLAGRPHG
jgi:hypothetical protein